MAREISSHFSSLDVARQFHAPLLHLANMASMAPPSEAEPVGPVRGTPDALFAVRCGSIEASDVASEQAWLDLIPLSPADGESAPFAVLPPRLARMRHSASPTHRVAVVRGGEGELIALAWPATSGARHGAEEVAEVELTRNYLEGRYKELSPLHCSLLLLPLLPHAARWAEPRERSAVQRRLRLWASEEGQRVDTARRRAEAASAAAGRLPSSASGRQVFLGWLAQAAGTTPPPPKPVTAPAAPAAPSAPSAPVAPSALAPGRRLRVHTDLPQLAASLCGRRFELVPRPGDPDAVRRALRV